MERTESASRARAVAVRWTAGVGLLLLAGLGAYASRGWWQAGNAAAAPPSFARPVRRTLAATVTATGAIRLRVGSEIRVGAQVSGIVRKLNVTVGSHIRRGEVIAEIDASGFEARLAQAQAAVAVADEDLRKSEVALSRAQALYERQIAPRQQLEDARLARDAAQAEVTKAQRDAAVVRTDMSYTTIRAPITGTVASVSTQEGETVAAAFAAPTFVTIIADHALELVAMVDETDIGGVAPGDAATFTVDAFPSREFTGRVERIAPTATIVSGVVNYEVEVTLEKAAEMLKPDMTANITIQTAERPALVVPNAAIHRSSEARYVYLAEGNQLMKRPVTTGVRDGSFTEIRKGVTTADRVLTSAPPQGKG